MLFFLNIINNFEDKTVPRLPVLLQLSDTECGIAALGMLFGFFGVNVSIETLREHCSVGRDGCKASTLIKIAQQYGFDAQAYKIEPEVIENLTTPVIAFWNFRHYVVIAGMSKNKFVIHDPAIGRLTITREEFDRYFTGVIIDITPKRKIAKTKNNLQLSFFTYLLKNFKIHILFLLGCSFVLVAITFLHSVIFRIMLDEATSIASSYIFCAFVGIWLLSLLQLRIGFILKLSQFRIDTHAALTKMSHIVNHIFQLPMLFFSLRQSSEIIVTLIKTEDMTSLLFRNVIAGILNLMTVCICLLAIASLDYTLVWVFIGFFIFMPPLFYFLNKTKDSEEAIANILQGKLTSCSTAIIQNMETIKACAMEDTVLIRWQQAFTNYITTQGKLTARKKQVENLLIISNQLLILGIICVGIHEVAQGQLISGGLMQATLLGMISYKAILAILQSGTELSKTVWMRARIADMMNRAKSKRFIAVENRRSLTDAENVFACRNVSFYYNKFSSSVLDDISFIIKKSQHVAFTGGTGSGKSTLAKMLCGLYFPDKGRLLLHGKDIATYSAAELAESIALVSQDACLFSGTLYENLVMFRKDILMSAVQQAIQTACLTEVVKERGLHAVIEPNGNNFSGGEKQRIDIARALLQNTPVLILDEATSALDMPTEARLIRNLCATDKTVIIVAHRLSAIQHCHQICVLEHGRLVEVKRGVTG